MRARQIKSGGSGSGASAFTDLTDAPASYTGQASKVVQVKADETGLEFAAASGGGGTSVVTPGLRSLGNPKYVRASNPVGVALSVGDNILYTAPTGRRAMINAIGVYNNNAASRTFYPTWRIGGTHYKFSGTLACTANSPNQVATSVVIILEPGESIGINVSGSDMNGFARVVEYDDTTPVYAPKKYSSWASGDNTLYTVPTGKCAILIDNVGTVQQNVNSLNYFNSSGGSRTIRWNSVPSGGSVGATNQVSGSSAVGNDTRSSLVQSHTLDAGDFININTNATTATQLAWCMVQELDV